MDTNTEPTQGNEMGTTAGDELNVNEVENGTSSGDAGNDVGSLAGTSTAAEEAEPSYAGAGTPDDGDVQTDPGSQVSG